jgi:hypothetical protein
MPSTETQDVGDAEEIQESAESAFATALQGIYSLSLVYYALIYLWHQPHLVADLLEAHTLLCLPCKAYGSESPL